MQNVWVRFSVRPRKEPIGPCPRSLHDPTPQRPDSRPTVRVDKHFGSSQNRNTFNTVLYRSAGRHQQVCGRPVVVGQDADRETVLERRVRFFRVLFAQIHFARESQSFRAFGRHRRGTAADLVDRHDFRLPRIGRGGHQPFHRIHLREQRGKGTRVNREIHSVMSGEKEELKLWA